MRTPQRPIVGRSRQAYFGVNAFTQEKYVAGSALAAIDHAAVTGEFVQQADADEFAKGLMAWALERNVAYVLSPAWALLVPTPIVVFILLAYLDRSSPTRATPHPTSATFTPF